MDNSSEWVDTVIRRLSTGLPHRASQALWSPTNEDVLAKTVECIVRLSSSQFAAVVHGLGGLLQDLIKAYPPAMATGRELGSYCTVLNCLTNCLAKRDDRSLDDEDLHSLQHLYQKITKLCLQSGDQVESLCSCAHQVLYHLSGLHFHGIFNKIILRVTSVNRATQESTGASERCVIQLIPHLNLNAARLQQILQVIVSSFKELKKHKQLFLTIPTILHRGIWNFISEYPLEYNELLKGHASSYPSVSRSAEKLFNMCDEYADGQKKKSQVWPLQNALLILCPHILKEIAESGIDSKSSPKHKSQRSFLSSIMKGLSSGNKLVSEAATVCGVDLFKICAFVGDHSTSVFRYLLNLIQGQLQNLLFSPSSMFLHQPSSVQAGIPTFSDLELIVTCLVAQFRCNHRNNRIFQVCLDSSSPTVFRLAFVEGIYTVLREKTRLSWWPGSEAVYTFSPHLREIFQNILPMLRRFDTSTPSLVVDVKAYLQSPATASAMLAAKNKAERKQLVEMITHYQLMQGLVKLFDLDPMLAFNESTSVGDCLELMTGLVGLVQHQAVPHVPLRASELLLTLHDPENIELWDPDDPMTAFWDISGQVTYSITQKLFSRKTSNPIELLGWLRRILHFRTQFLRRHESEASQGSSCKISQQMYTMLETVLLLFLRNTNVEAVRIAMSCFKYLCIEAELVTSPTEPSAVPYAPNIRAYRQLEEASRTLQIGRAAQQKKIRAILKELVHSQGSALAWEDTYSSWRVTKSLLLAYQREDAAPPDLLRFTTESLSRNFMKKVTHAQLGLTASNKDPQLTEDNLQSTLLNWTNMTGFLCSLAGVSTKPSSSYSFLISGAAPSNIIDGGDITQLVQPTSHSKVKRSSSYHGRPKSVQSPYRVSAVNIVSESVPNRLSGEGMLEDPTHHSRTSQTEAFVSELMRLLSCNNDTVGMNVRETVKELVSYELSPPVYPYLFHCMTVESMKAFGIDGKLQISESNTGLFDQLVSIVQRILETKVEGALEHLVHVKMDEVVLNLVIYAANLDSTAQSLTIRIKLSHLIETVMHRSRDLSFRHEVQFRNQMAEYLTQWVTGEVCISETPSHEENLRNELGLCAMRAIGPVLSGLVLKPKDMTGDIIEQKGKLFLKYFTSFLNLIHSLNGIEWSKLGPIHRPPLQRHVSCVREATCSAMSNMLTANIDIGLTHAIGLGYHEDLKTRTSFMEVLTSILKQGAEFNSLADTILADRHNQMLELVTTETTDGEIPIMMALISSVPPEYVDDLAEVLVVLFDYKNKLCTFLTRILNTEVEALESGRLDTLFRGNSIACKVLSCSFKTFGLYYLQSVVRPLILQLMKSNDKEYEVDPARLLDLEKLERNQSNLLELVQTFYTTILNSLSSLPLQLRMVCHILYNVVASHSTEASLDTVNSAIFLRFINPAIVSPQSYNLVQGEIPVSVQRGLTFISKVLQNLANHILFKKEAHMEVFNKFLVEHFEHSRELALAMASMGPYGDSEAGEYIAFLKESYKHRLHSLLWNSQERMVAYAASTRTCVSARHLFHDLNTLLAQLGAPNYRRNRTSMTTRSALVSSQLEEFLDSMANECDEKTLRSIKAKEIFYQSGVSRAGNPVFYFIARKFRGEQLHVSYQLLYHIMSLLKSCTDKAFELVIDLTQAAQCNEPDLELLVKFAAYVPELVMSQIESVYFFSVNTAFKQYANKLATAIRIFSHIKGAKRVVLVDSLGRFSEYIESCELRLPSSTMVFEEERKAEFVNVRYLLFRQPVTLQIPAMLQVCSCGLVVILTDREKMFDIPITLKEVYHISDIREVLIEGKGSLAVRLAEGGQLLRFTSGEADVITQAITEVISKWQNQQPSRYMSERKLEPKDVPGTFLNLALLNLGSTDAGLRVAAYKLLSAVKDAFHLRINRHLESGHDLCIPMNSAQFVVSISEQLAQNEPHLTLEFLSEVVAGFQQYTPALKQLCLAYMSPWLPNLSRFAARAENISEQEKVAKLIDLLVALTISEQEMYPLIQTCVWAKIGGECELLKRVLDSFIRMGISDGLGSRKLEVLADTAVTLAQGEDGNVALCIIKKMLKTVAHTSDRVTTTLEQHFLWSELTALSRFLLALSFNNKVNVVNNLTDVFYLCVLMMAYGPVFVRATIHGIIMNMVQSLGSLPEVMSNEEALKCVSLKLAEFSDPKFYRQFGIQHTASQAAYQRSIQTSASHHSVLDSRKDSLSSCNAIAITKYLLAVVESCEGLFPNCGWMARWQKLAKRTSFHYNPALQTRSFLMLGVISQRASPTTVTRTLKVLEETMERHEDDVALLEAIVICLTQMVPLLDENTKLNQHLFWVAVGMLQLGEATLFATGLALMEACIKALTSRNAFEDQSLALVMQPTRDAMEWPLSQMDREVGISFSSDFNFALAGLLYKGFSHPLSTIRTKTQELLTTLFFIHSPGDRDVFEVNQVNLAYVTALFPESEIVRQQLRERRPRLKTLMASLSIVEGEREEGPSSFSALLSTQTIVSHKLQILFLLMLACALNETQNEQKIQLLYEFLADASRVYHEVFPLIHYVLMEHMIQTLKQSQSSETVAAIQRLITVAVERGTALVLLKSSYISDAGFLGLRTFFRPFPKHGLIYPTGQGAVFQKYLEALVQELSPSTESLEKTNLSRSSHSLSSMKDFNLSAPFAPLLPRRSGSFLPRGTSLEDENPPEHMGLSCDEEELLGETEL